MSSFVRVSASVLVAVSVALMPSLAANETQEVPYVSVLGGFEQGCEADNTLDDTIAAAKAIGAVLGTSGAPGGSHCVAVPSGATSLALQVVDDSGLPLHVSVSQHSAADLLDFVFLCGGGEVALDAEAVDVRITLVPYGVANTSCEGAGIPTTGTLLIDWL